MPYFAFRQVSRIRRLAFLLNHRPQYILGRFAIFRDAYSKVNAVKDAAIGAPPFKIGNLYENATASLEIASSGHLLPVAPASQQVHEMRTRSYSPGPHLGVDAIAQLRKAAHSLPIKVKGFGPMPLGLTTYEQLSTSRELRDRIAIATVDNSSSIPIVRALAGDSLLYEVAQLFLGYRPKQVSSWLFWSFANGLSDDTRRAVYQTIDFHYDVDGFNFMYANFYLLETGPLNGAHVLIEGTARKKRLRDLMGIARLADSEVRKAYGGHRERLIEGPAGFGFLEDASCYHKALAPHAGDRLMLQLRYQ